MLDFMLLQANVSSPLPDWADQFLSVHPHILAGLVGFISGLIASIPVGPINLTIVNEGARRGFRWAAMIGLGATLMEAIYCYLAFTGFASFFERGYIKSAMELFSFMFLFFLGVKFLLARSVAAPMHISATADRLEERIEGRFKPTSAFMTGFVRVMANPGVFLLWLLLAANFISREWVHPMWDDKLICVGGVVSAVGLWFLGLSWAVSLKHGKLQEKTLVRIENLSGVGLLFLAFLHAAHIIWRMAHHHSM